MELRPDITLAAARLTSGFDVSRELRQLGAHLREGETVQRLASGVYGSGGGLLAVTDHRVLLLRDGRGGQASEGFPLERLTSVRWVPGPARGTIAIIEEYHTAELTQVEPVEGVEVVELIRSLMPYGEEDEPEEEAGEDVLLTHGVPALAGAAASAGTTGMASSATRSGRFSVRMKLRQRRDVPLGASEESAGLVPEQKTTSGRSGPSHAVARPPAAEPGRSSAGTGSYPATGSGAYALAGTGSRPLTGTGSHTVTGSGSRVAPWNGSAGLPLGAVPVSVLTPTSTGPEHVAVGHAWGVESGVGTLVGEVPVRVLAVETGPRDAVSGSVQHGRDVERTGEGRTRNERTDRGRTAPSGGIDPLATTGPQPGRGESAPDGGAHSRWTSDHQTAPRRNKWLWIGGVAAGVAALGAVGGVALLRHSSSPAPITPAPAPAAAGSPAAGPVVRVVKVINADTIEVNGPFSGPVEVVGITAPRAAKDQCGASESTAFASRSLMGTNVTLIGDPSQPAIDTAGRRLATLRTENGFDYAVLAARAGMVRSYDGARPVAQAEEIKAAQTEAEKSKLGLWGPPCNGRVSALGSGSSNAKAAGGSRSDSNESGSGRSSGNQTGSGQSGSGQAGGNESASGRGSARSGSGLNASDASTTSRSASDLPADTSSPH